MQDVYKKKLFSVPSLPKSSPIQSKCAVLLQVLSQLYPDLAATIVDKVSLLSKLCM